MKSFLLNDKTVLEWFRHMWCRNPGKFLEPRSMLILDFYRSHITDRVKKSASGHWMQLGHHAGRTDTYSSAARHGTEQAI